MVLRLHILSLLLSQTGSSMLGAGTDRRHSVRIQLHSHIPQHRHLPKSTLLAQQAEQALQTTESVVTSHLHDEAATTALAIIMTVMITHVKILLSIPVCVQN